MTFNKVIHIFRNPRFIKKYLVKYGNAHMRKIFYFISSKFNVNIRKYFLKNINVICGVSRNESLLNFVRTHYRNTFLCNDFDSVIDILKSDRDFVNQVLAMAGEVINNKFYILYDYHSNMREDISPHYKWFIDYRTGYEYKSSFYLDTRKNNNVKGVDIKHIWETARMQYLFAPALAYRLTGDEMYAIKVKDILSDFINQNKKDIGPNWSPSMEVGIRLANIILSVELIIQSDCFDEQFVRLMVCAVYEHRQSILQNEENITRTSNHYLGGLLGLAACSAFLPFLKENDKIFSYVCDSLNRELDVQILDDGGDYEGSSSYHRLVGELLGFTILACRNAGFSLDTQHLMKYRKMGFFTDNLMHNNGFVPQIGDNDCGRVFQLLAEDALDHRFFSNLCSGLVDGTYFDDLYVNHLLIFLGNNLTKHTSGRFIPTTWYASDSGIARIRNKNFDIIVYAIDAQKVGMGGHTHNDALSFELWVDEAPFFVDAGTYCYTSNPELRNRFRSVFSHNSICVDETEPRGFIENFLFGWNGKYTSKLMLEDENIISGVADYSLQNIHIKRYFNLESFNLVIMDDIVGEFSTISSRFILHPSVQIEREEKKIIIYNEATRIMLSGTWNFEIEHGYYSDKYDRVIETNCMKINSRMKKNILRIEYVRL